MGWLEPGGTRAPSGARAICNWDEDALTLAVEAGRECLRGVAAPPQAVTLVSTTLPFVDRSNATLVAAALDLAPETQTLDVTGTLRAATTALAQAAGRSDGMRTLVIAADARTARPGSAQELEFGSAAVALLVSSATPSGRQSALADIRGVAHLSADLVDHYRASGEAFDYALEERWVRDEGLAKLVPDTVRMALERAAVKSSDVQHCVLPVAPAAAQRLLRSLGIDQAHLTDALREDCGDSGAAHPLLMLAAALEAAAPGDHILHRSRHSGH